MPVGAQFLSLKTRRILANTATIVQGLGEMLQIIFAFCRFTMCADLLKDLRKPAVKELVSLC